jgi:hypothetical protein
MNKDLCKRILEYAPQMKWYRGDRITPSGIVFKSSLAPIYPSMPIYDEVMAYAAETIPYFESQFVEVRLNKYEVSDHMERHLDCQQGRLWTIIVQISESEDYEGGDLLVNDYPFSREQGASVLFDSQTTWHAVNEIISGIRYSMVFWSYRKEAENE